MIKSFKHKGLENLFYKNVSKGVKPEHKDKLLRQMDMLNNMKNIKELPIGWRVHKLKGDKNNLYSIMVSGNWRLTFEFDHEDVYILDYDDYH